LTLVFLLVNKVFSPQYLLWLLPFFVLCQELASKKFFYSLEVANLLVLLLVIAPILYSELVLFLYLSLLFVFIRHLLLGWLLIRTFKYAKTHL
jgi:hypothetical protein